MTKPAARPASAPATVATEGLDDADLFLGNQLSFALYTASNRIARLYNVILKPFGLTFPQLLCLMALWEKSPLLVGDIAKKLELDNGTITPLLKRLEQNGFIRRSRDVADERRVYVSVLDKAEWIKTPLRQTRNEVAAAIQWEPDLVASLRNGVKKFSRDISEM